MEIEQLSKRETVNGAATFNGATSATLAASLMSPPTGGMRMGVPPAVSNGTSSVLFHSPIPSTTSAAFATFKPTFTPAAAAGAAGFTSANYQASMMAAAALVAAQANLEQTPQSASWARVMQHPGATFAAGGGGGAFGGGGGGARKRARDMDTAPPPLQLKTYVADRSSQAQDNGTSASTLPKGSTESGLH